MFTFEEFTDFVEGLRPAIRSTVDRYIGVVSVEYKGDNSPVTMADREIEKLIVEKIQARFPQSTIVGEESGTHQAAAPNASGKLIEWVIDPIDGTRSFIHGVPLFATLIGVMVDGKACYGAIYNPLLEDLVVGDCERALWNGKPTQMRDTEDLASALLLTTDIKDVKKHRNIDKFNELADSCRILRTWGDAYGYFLLATGRADVMVDPIMSRWDLVALIPVIEGAGGVITDYYGGEASTADSIVAVSKELHSKVIAALN